MNVAGGTSFPPGSSKITYHFHPKEESMSNSTAFDELVAAIKRMGDANARAGFVSREKVDEIVENAIKEARWQEAEARVRRIVIRMLVFVAYSALDAWFVTLMIGAWHAHSGIPAYGYLLIWPTLMVLRCVYSLIVWKRTDLDPNEAQR